MTTENPDQRLFDPGLQPERTALAWRRTGLALMVASLIALRILPDNLGSWALAPSLLGLVAAITVLYLAHQRQTALNRALTDRRGSSTSLPTGRLPLLMAIVVSSGGTAALILTFSPSVAP
jgi:uncharacterized membrane protein YidH (DUF202 family)